MNPFRTLTAAGLVAVAVLSAPASACEIRSCIPDIPKIYLESPRYCKVDVGYCAPGARCTVNVGYCAAGGNCAVNVGYCDDSTKLPVGT